MPATPVVLRVNYLVNPIGLDDRRPRFFWRLDDPRHGARQTAYRIRVAMSATALGAEDLMWDSGRIESDVTTHVEYAGPALASRQNCHWNVESWDADGVPSMSAGATFEMGLLDRWDWTATWIEGRVVGGPRTTPAAPLFRRSFTLASAPASARLYITALGLYEAHLNGTRVGDDMFTPGRTEYAKRVQYHVYDVASMLHAGDNVIGVILGDGWYSGHVHHDPRQRDGDRPRLFAQLEITAADGSRTTITSDPEWRTATGPILSNDLLQGESYDARLELPDWSKPGGGTEDDWLPVRTFADPKIAIVASASPPVRRQEELTAIAPPRRLKRGWIFDLGQNMVGRVRLKVRGKAGQTFTLRHAEMLDKDGSLYTTALRSARATDHYTLKDDAEAIWEPRFTFHGFRYVEVVGLPINSPPPIDTVTGIVLNTDLEPAGSFTCSDPMINQLQSNIRWSQKGNFLEIPTDCPQRDERLGWTGDAQVFIRTASHNMLVAPFFDKWLLDMEDAQFPTGGIPSTVPFCPSIPNEGGPAWSDAALICPMVIYDVYGDRRVLAERYGMMQRFIGFLEANSVGRVRADKHWKWQGYGDWLSHNAETPKEVIGTAFFSHSARLLARIARSLELDADAAKYDALADEVRDVWRTRYTSGAGLLVSQTQTAAIVALHFELLPESQRTAVFESLVRDIESRGTHLSTGFVGTPYLNHVLTRFGRIDLAYALLHQTTAPSWLFPITHGATTMWERWDGWTPEKGFNDAGMNSYNHYAYGAVGEWMYSAVAGLDRDPVVPGFKRLRIAPRPEHSRLTRASACYDTLHGTASSSWTLEGQDFTLDVTVPPNCTASVRVPGRSITLRPAPDGTISRVTKSDETADATTFEVVAGRYRFSSISSAEVS